MKLLLSVYKLEGKTSGKLYYKLDYTGKQDNKARELLYIYIYIYIYIMLSRFQVTSFIANLHM